MSEQKHFTPAHLKKARQNMNYEKENMLQSINNTYIYNVKKRFFLNEWLNEHCSVLEDMWVRSGHWSIRVNSISKHVPRTTQPCNLLLGTVQAACLTENKVRRHLLLGSPRGFLLIEYLPFNLPWDWVTLKVTLSSLKNENGPPLWLSNVIHFPQIQNWCVTFRYDTGEN